MKIIEYVHLNFSYVDNILNIFTNKVPAWDEPNISFGLYGAIFSGGLDTSFLKNIQLEEYNSLKAYFSESQHKVENNKKIANFICYLTTSSGRERISSKNSSTYHPPANLNKTIDYTSHSFNGPTIFKVVNGIVEYFDINQGIAFCAEFLNNKEMFPPYWTEQYYRYAGTHFHEIFCDNETAPQDSKNLAFNNFFNQPKTLIDAAKMHGLGTELKASDRKSIIHSWRQDIERSILGSQLLTENSLFLKTQAL